MLDRRHRLTQGRDFTQAVRGGRRAGTPSMVVHLRHADTADGGRAAGGVPVHPGQHDEAASDAPALVGLIVGRGVGNAVVRNRVKRRLRHLARARLDLLPPASLLVIRALPGAGEADAGVLGGHLDAALSRLLRRPDARDRA